jgi:hypothetical protein
MHATAPTPVGEEQQSVPPDIATMRATVDRLLDPDTAPDVLPPAGDELDTLISAMRGQLEVIIPEVEKAFRPLSKSDPQRYCVLACVGEARQKLRIGLDHAPNREVAVALARKLARSLNALCNHYETLNGATS